MQITVRSIFAIPVKFCLVVLEKKSVLVDCSFRIRMSEVSIILFSLFFLLNST